MGMIFKLGPERAMMWNPISKVGLLVKGAEGITARLAAGWLLLKSDRNKLNRDADLYELKGTDAVPVAGEDQPAKQEQSERPKRSRRHR